MSETQVGSFKPQLFICQATLKPDAMRNGGGRACGRESRVAVVEDGIVKGPCHSAMAASLVSESRATDRPMEPVHIPSRVVMARPAGGVAAALDLGEERKVGRPGLRRP
jgi:hypothetical protein